MIKSLAGFCLFFCLFLFQNALSAQQITIEPEESPAPSARKYSGVEVKGHTEFCEGGETLLWVEGDFESFEWSDGSSERSIRVKKAGAYEVTVKTKGGCTFTSSVNVRTRPCT
jgi:hypothetical protein